MRVPLRRVVRIVARRGDSAAAGGWARSVAEFVTDHRVDRFLGALLLNQHARLTLSPWVAYLDWLRREGRSADAERLSLPGCVRTLARTGAAVEQALGVLAESGQVDGAAVYMVGACCNHSCEPNAEARGNDAGMQLVALTRITAGNEVTISYVDESILELPLDARRKHLQRAYKFWCSCPRCAREGAEQRAYAARMYAAGRQRPSASYVSALYARRGPARRHSVVGPAQ